MSSQVGQAYLKILEDHSGMKDERDYISDGPLSPDEARATRALLRDAAYSKRFWATTRLWLGWTSGSIIFVLTFWDKIKAYIPANFPWGSP